MEEAKSIFESLNAVNVNDHTEQKNVGASRLTYLSWAWAWSEVMKRYPDASYTIWRNPEGKPYLYDENAGYMVFTTVTIKGETRGMWLPVMDGTNKAMMAEAYEYSTKFGKKRVEKATMTDINKTIMRCLTKNLAMFGLGLYIYAGEDLPEEDGDDKPQDAPQSAAKAKTNGNTTKTAKAAQKAADKPKEAEMPPEYHSGMFCDVCGGEIKAVEGKDGKWYSPEYVEGIGQKRFGRRMCAACQNDARKKAAAG